MRICVSRYGGTTHVSGQKNAGSLRARAVRVKHAGRLNPQSRHPPARRADP